MEQPPASAAPAPSAQTPPPAETPPPQAEAATPQAAPPAESQPAPPRRRRGDAPARDASTACRTFIDRHPPGLLVVGCGTARRHRRAHRPAGLAVAQAKLSSTIRWVASRAPASPTMARDFSSGDTALRSARSARSPLSSSRSRARTSGRGSAPEAPPPRHATSRRDETISSETAINLDQGDPLAEADFHMAYGLYDQAADLVRIAIAREPDRRDLKLKLLEVFFVWGNKEQFLQTARELAQTRDAGGPGRVGKDRHHGQAARARRPAVRGRLGLGGGGRRWRGPRSRGRSEPRGLRPARRAGAGRDPKAWTSTSARRWATGTRRSNRPREPPMRTWRCTTQDFSGDATTRQMTQRVQSEEPAPVMPEYGMESAEAPTVEQPGMYGQSIRPSARRSTSRCDRAAGGDQTAELDIDDLGLDLAALDTVDQPGLGCHPGRADAGCRAR